MYECRYCAKSYVKESTLVAHLCEPKRRANQEKDPHVQLGFKAYHRFYELTQGGKQRSYSDFSASQYYSAFVKFGHYCRQIRCINFNSFLEWLLKENKKLDYWTKDSFYTDWLTPYIKNEDTQTALERALNEMQSYAENDERLQGNFANYFRHGAANRVIHHITTGRISPWVVFNCDSGVDFLTSLNEEQLKIVMPIVDPDYWQRRFKDLSEDTEWTKEVLKAAGL